MANDRYGRPRRRKKKRSALYGPLTFIVVCAALAFALSVFFRVSAITVDGGTRYTDEEIIEASGISEGDNLFFINRFTAANRIFSKLPYVEDAVISRQMPNKVTIQVSESVAAAYISDPSGYWLISAGGKALETTDAYGIIGVAEVTGLTIAAPTAGEYLVTAEENDLKLIYLADILTAAKNKNMLPSMSNIDLTNAANPSFRYLNRFTVKLGAREDTAHKLDLFLSAVEQLPEPNSGVIDLSIDQKAHFTPD